MKTTKSIEISVEREEVLLIRKPANRTTLWCAECGARSPMVTLEEAMALTGESSCVTDKRKESGPIHFTESREGLLLVCLNSLSRALK